MHPEKGAPRLNLPDALRVAFSWIAPLPDGRGDSEATCAYVPREVYDRLREALDAAK